MTRITKIEFIPLGLPLDKPVTLKECTLTHLYVWVCRITDAAGQSGEGYTHHILPAVGFPILKKITQDWFSQLIDKEPNQIQTIQITLMQQIKQEDSKFYYYFLSAIDIACWDLWLKQENKSLANHLDIDPNTTVPVYGSGGWLSYSDEELLAECQYYIDLGCKAYKFKLGTYAKREEDYRRIRLLQGNFPNLILYADSNQEYSLEQAQEVAKKLEKFNIQWLEEPIKNDVTDEVIALSLNTKVPIATGENRFYDAELDELCHAKSNVQFLQPDIVRCGGISALLRILDLCIKSNRRFAPHLNPTLSATIAAIRPETSCVEDAMRLFPKKFLLTKQIIKDGAMTLSDEPGVGTYIDLDKASLFVVSQ